MKRSTLLLSVFSFSAVFAAPSASGETPSPKKISGELSGKHPAAEYMVSGNAVVSRRKTATFEAGSVLRFEIFSGITVRGSLVCKGTPGRPVIFTSANDVKNADSSPEPFDWNGIKVSPEAGAVTLEQCVVAYSTFGIGIESGTTPVKLTNCTFHHNGTASFTREKKIMPVRENIPFSYSGLENRPVSPVVKAGAGKNGGTPDEKRLTPPEPAWKKTGRISGAAAAIGGAALWLTGFFCAEHCSGLITPNTPSGLAREYKDSWDRWITVRNAGIGLFGIGAAGFAVTFAF